MSTTFTIVASDNGALIAEEVAVTTLTRTSTVQPNISLDTLRTFCKQRRITGELRIVLNDGGVRQIFLSEQKRVDNAKTKM